MLNKEQVQDIAKLARISLSSQELESYQKDLSKILDFVDKLKEVKIGGGVLAHHALKVSNVMREDSPRAFDDKALGQKLVDMAPSREDRYIKVKPIFNKH